MADSILTAQHSTITLPALIERAGQSAGKQFIEFFTVDIPNCNTGLAYARAVVGFLHWCDKQNIAGYCRLNHLTSPYL